MVTTSFNALALNSSGEQGHKNAVFGTRKFIRASLSWESRRCHDPANHLANDLSDGKAIVARHAPVAGKRQTRCRRHF